MVLLHVVQAIKDEIEGLNIIGIRILDGHGSYNFYATYGDGIDYEKYKKDMRKMVLQYSKENNGQHLLEYLKED